MPVSVLERLGELGKLTSVWVFYLAVVRSIIWWRNLWLSRNLSWVVVIIDCVVAGLIVATAYFGGQLVYEFGVGVSAAGAAAQ